MPFRQTWLQPRPHPRGEIRSALKERVARIFALTEEDCVSVNEVACGAPGCPDVETVILLMCVGRPMRALKISAPMEEVEDVELELLAVEHLAAAAADGS